MRKITVTEGLNELKLYDSRITKEIENAVFCGFTKKSSDKVGIFSREEFEKRVKATLQSVTDMIKNRDTLKSLIVESNAVTQVSVGDKVMTRARAIERKSSIEYEELLLQEMKKQYATITQTVNRENKRVDDKVDDLIASLVGKDSDKKLSAADQEAIEKPYRDNNEYEFIDPISLLDKINELEKDIETFKSSIDTALVLSNSTSYIEVDF